MDNWATFWVQPRPPSHPSSGPTPPHRPPPLQVQPDYDRGAPAFPRLALLLLKFSTQCFFSSCGGGEEGATALEAARGGGAGGGAPILTQLAPSLSTQPIANQRMCSWAKALRTDRHTD